MSPSKPDATGAPSRFWPYIKAVGKAVAELADKSVLPGAKAGMGLLIDFQDAAAKAGAVGNLADPQVQSDLKAALDEIRADTAEIVRRLHEDKLPVAEDRLSDYARSIAEALYLRGVADEYLYADFKGIEQFDRLVSLELDEVFINLRARPEARGDRPSEEERRLLAGLESAEPAARDSLEQQLHRLDRLGRGAGDLLRAGRMGPMAIDDLLARPGGVVLLGGPGSGKTTLVKRLARHCAKAFGEDPQPQQNFPRLPWCFPVVVAVTLYDDWRNRRAGQEFGLLGYVEHVLAERGGLALVAAFRLRWAAGEVLLLADGLDEVAETGRRIGAARAVDELVPSLAENRLLVTSRIVGYRICRLAAPAGHFELEPFEPRDIEAFARQWHLALERAIHPERPNLAAAEAQAKELLDEIRAREHVQSLVTNPLMLTICALIKHQGVRLPDRRVELYHAALTTLVKSWNKARSLAGRDVGREERDAPTERVWGAVAHWMHQETSRGTVHRSRLKQELVRVLGEMEVAPYDAEERAEGFIVTASESSGLLEARGADFFAFVHQTFQEYLAAMHVAIPTSKARERILQVSPDPRWHEVVRLAVGYIGTLQKDYETASELVTALLNDARDPLEPYLSTHLRLAAACLADDVRVKRQVSDRVIVSLFDRLEEMPYRHAWDALIESLTQLPVSPGRDMLGRLTEAAFHKDWLVRQEAARLLARVSDLEPAARDTLESLFRDEDWNVRAHAAYGLWRAGRTDQPEVVRAIVYGLTSHPGRLRLKPDHGLAVALTHCLRDVDRDVRLIAASVLNGWGYQAHALPALIESLGDADRDVRLGAAQMLAAWGHQAKAVSGVVECLKDVDAYVRLEAAEVLRQWGRQREAVPALLECLRDARCSVRLDVAEELGEWGRQAQAMPALLDLLRDADPCVRVRAAEVLGEWGHQAEAVPVLLECLGDADGDVRIHAAEVLGEWGHQGQAVPMVVKWLGDGLRFVRFHAAEVLGKWLPEVGGVGRTVFQGLMRRRCDAALEFFHQAATRGPGEPPPSRTDEVNRLLLAAITPRPDDSGHKRALRDVVFRWVWNTVHAGT